MISSLLIRAQIGAAWLVWSICLIGAAAIPVAWYVAMKGNAGWQTFDMFLQVAGLVEAGTAAMLIQSNLRRKISKRKS